MTTTDTKTFEQILSETARFIDRSLAFSYANRPGKKAMVMLGDDDRFWITTPANCVRLERMGYEWAD